MHETGVVLGFDDPALQEEVLHFLDRLPRVRVVGVAADGPDLARRVREGRPAVVVAAPSIVAGAPDLDGASLFVVAPTETTSSLRAALRAGADGFYLWPEERAGLGRDAERAARPRRAGPAREGRVIAVHAPRGGAGCTFLATNLAAACADRDAECVLVDLDGFAADVTAALGLREDESLPTIADLARVSGEVTDEHLERVLSRHERGFRVLPAPRVATQGVIPPAEASSLVVSLRDRFDAVLLHLPRAIGSSELAALEESDVALIVVTLDVLGVRAARRALDRLAEAGLEPRCRLVINRAVRGEIVPEDVERALGVPIAATIRRDRAVPRAQNRARLLASRGTPAGRRVAALAASILEEERSR
ncbi:MAG TPA: AAA family ATPase [Actinomycetota bacterium]|nr:AAA family ATPase [Actinomycetota bacterium]